MTTFSSTVRFFVNEKLTDPKAVFAFIKYDLLLGFAIFNKLLPFVNFKMNVSGKFFIKGLNALHKNSPFLRCFGNEHLTGNTMELCAFNLTCVNVLNRNDFLCTVIFNSDMLITLFNCVMLPLLKMNLQFPKSGTSKAVVCII